MKQIILPIIAGFFINQTISQNKGITLETDYGSDNIEIRDLLRAEGIETDVFKFKGNDLKGKNYKILVKEFTNGSLSNIDTIIDSKSNDYIKPLDQAFFNVKLYVKTQIDNTVKMSFTFDRFFSSKTYDIKHVSDNYALHDFTGGTKDMVVPVGKPTYIGTYFLPYHDEETGYKMYCQVSNSKYKPEEWGRVFNVSNYFLIEAQFE